jgi:predicted nucleic acid-binding Zn ribbon protein
VDAVDDHRHCKVCGKPCDLSDDTCSKACRRTLDGRRQAKVNYTYLMYGAIAILAVFLILQLTHG